MSFAVLINNLKKGQLCIKFREGMRTREVVKQAFGPLQWQGCIALPNQPTKLPYRLRPHILDMASMHVGFVPSRAGCLVYILFLVSGIPIVSTSAACELFEIDQQIPMQIPGQMQILAPDQKFSDTVHVQVRTAFMLPSNRQGVWHVFAGVSHRNSVAHSTLSSVRHRNWRKLVCS